MRLRRPLSAAIIGCGRVAWMLEDDPLEVKPCTHMGAYRAIEAGGRVKVAAAADTDTERLKAFGERFGVEALYSDYREMLRNEGPEIVSVCAYATDRHRMVMDAISSGVKGIWCEKALCTSIKEGREMIRAVEESKASLIVSHLRRWSGDYRKAKEIIENGEIGQLQSIVCHFSGSLIHTGTHAFDVLRWLGGPFEWVEGSLEERTGGLPWELSEDPGGRAFIKFRNGAHGAVFAEAKRYFFFEFDIVGSSGRIRIGNNEVLEYYKSAPSRHYTGLRELESVPFPAYGKIINIFTGALTNLLDCVEGIGKSENSAEDGLAALEAALAIHESARSGKRVCLPLEDSELTVRSR